MQYDYGFTTQNRTWSIGYPSFMSNNKWSSRIAFIITTSAFAVGLGNIWRFPYIAGEGGGGAFLLVYFILIILIGIPVLTIEISLGNMSRSTPLIGFSNITQHKSWNLIGWLGVIANVLIMSYYVMIMAWIVAYIWEFISGGILQIVDAQVSNHFDLIASNQALILGLILLILTASFLIVNQGLKTGLERYSKIMMIGLVILLISLTLWSASLEGAIEGYRWFLYPDFSKITTAVIISALGQLFFSIGVGMAVAFVFGSYTSSEENILSSTTWIVLADTFFAVLAGLMIFPVIFSFGLSPDSGPNLIFITMATAFRDIDHGWILGGLFFILLFLAGFTSLLSSVQAIQDSLKDRFHITNTQSILYTVGAIGLISIPVVFSYVDEPITLFGMTIFGFLDYLTNNIMLPLGGLLIVLFSGHVIGFDRLSSALELNDNTKNTWKPIVKYIIPLAILIILINGLL